MVRVLLAVHGFPPTHSAGAERRAERKARWLAAHGHEVTVFAVEKLDEPGFRVEKGEQDGYTVHRLFYDLSSGDPLRNRYDFPPVGQAFRDIVTRGRFDLVHLVSGYLLGGQVVHTARELGLPVIITLTEYWFICPRLNLLWPTGHLCDGLSSDARCALCMLEEKRRYRLPAQFAPWAVDLAWKVVGRTSIAAPMRSAIHERRAEMKTVLAAADRVICPSQHLIHRFAEAGFDTSRFLHVRQGLNLPPTSARRIESSSGSPLRIGYIGQIKLHKGVDLLTNAVDGLLRSGERVTLDIWGTETEEPDYVNRLKARTAERPEIRWNGRYTGTKVWDVLANLDVLVVPSRWYENSPNAILEAYAMGVPVIATNLGGMAELVEHERTGLLFELDDADDLRRQLEQLLKEPDLLPRLRANIPPVKSLDAHMEELVSLYQDVLVKIPQPVE